MTQFLTVEEFKAMPLPITDKQYEKITDAELQDTIIRASDHIEEYLDRRIGVATYTERIMGNGRNFIILENRPVLEVNSITAVDMRGTSFSYDPELVIIQQNAGLLRFIDATRYAWWSGQWWVIDYDAGYANIPSVIKQATGYQTLEFLQPLFRGGTNFVEVELVEGLNEIIVDILEAYKNKRIG
jgi:hypothetical protein